MGFCACGSGGGSSRARYYLQVGRAKRGGSLANTARLFVIWY